MLGPHEPGIAWRGAFGAAVARRRRGPPHLARVFPRLFCSLAAKKQSFLRVSL